MSRLHGAFAGLTCCRNRLVHASVLHAGDVLDIPAKFAPRFSFGQPFKDAVNGVVKPAKPAPPAKAPKAAKPAAAPKAPAVAKPAAAKGVVPPKPAPKK